MNASAKVDLLSVFFPMWNEEDYVERAVRAAEDECQRLVGLGEIAAYELVIIDDCSTDRTPEIADALAAADPRIRVVHHPVNRGLGGSIKTGFDVRARRRRPLHRRRPAVRDARARPRPAGAAPLRGRHGQRLPAGPHRRGSAPRGLLLRLQLAGPADLRHPGAGHQLRVQAGAAATSSRPPARSARVRSSTPSWSSGRRSWASTSCRSASTTSRAPAGVSTLSSPAVIRRMLREMRELRAELKHARPRRPVTPAARGQCRRHGPHPRGLPGRPARAPDGIVTSTSVLAVGTAFEQAATTVRDAGDLALGAHLAIVGEDRPLLSRPRGAHAGRPRGALPALLPDRRRPRRGRPDRPPTTSPGSSAPSWSGCGGIGVPVTHLDTHQHTHLWPAVAAVVVDLAREAGIRSVRLPGSRRPGRWVPASGCWPAGSAAGWTGRAGHHRRLCRPGRGGAPGRRAVRRCPAAADRRRARRRAEINTHPGEAGDPALARFDWGYRWADELAMLTAPSTRALVERLGWRLGTFADVAGARPMSRRPDAAARSALRAYRAAPLGDRLHVLRPLAELPRSRRSSRRCRPRAGCSRSAAGTGCSAATSPAGRRSCGCSAWTSTRTRSPSRRRSGPPDGGRLTSRSATPAPSRRAVGRRRPRGRALPAGRGGPAARCSSPAPRCWRRAGVLRGQGHGDRGRAGRPGGTPLQEALSVRVLKITAGRRSSCSSIPDERARWLVAAGLRDVRARRLDRGRVHPHHLLVGAPHPADPVPRAGVRPTGRIGRYRRAAAREG